LNDKLTFMIRLFFFRFWKVTVVVDFK